MDAPLSIENIVSYQQSVHISQHPTMLAMSTSPYGFQLKQYIFGNMI